LLSKEAQLRANNVLSGLHTAQSETQLGQSITSEIFNTLPVSSLFDYAFGKKKSNASESSFSWGV
jgi:hypothetical protein